jgi:hypothetical protein
MTRLYSPLVSSLVWVVVKMVEKSLTDKHAELVI